MQSHEVLKEAFEKSSPKAIASDLGVSLSLVYKWAQDQSDSGSGSRNPLDRIMEIYRHTEHIEMIEWLCEQSGGYFVKEHKHEATQAFDVLPATNEILLQFSEMLSEISESAQDNSITADEAAEIRQRWNKLKGHAEGFVQACEDGDFQLIKNAAASASAKPEAEKPRTRLY